MSAPPSIIITPDAKAVNISSSGSIPISKANGLDHFDINTGIADVAKAAIFPSLSCLPHGIGKGIISAEQYVDAFDAFSKSLDAPPSMQPYARVSQLPTVDANGVIQWPEIKPEAIKKIARENVAVQMIIGMRVDDVLKYANRSSHPWKPGWKIEMRAAKKQATDHDRQSIVKAEAFIENCNAEITLNACKRDGLRYTSFRQFLSSLVRNTLTFDGMAAWTDKDDFGMVKAFKLYSAGDMRFVSQERARPLDPKKNLNEDTYIVMVNEGDQIVKGFSRDEFVFYTRNSRVDYDVFNYGLPEITSGVKLIQGFTNALTMNIDQFERSGYSQAIMALKGIGWTQTHVDVLTRMWSNLQKGITKAWNLPVLKVPADGAIEVVDLTKIKGMDVWYQELMNMLMGAFCVVYRFPVHRLGYRISGKGQDTEVKRDDQTTNENEDAGLPVLLGHIETFINEYFLWTRFPELQFVFTGKDPKADAREYEFKTACMTYGEQRAATDSEDLTQINGLTEEQKKINEIMNNCPVNSILVPVYQSAIQLVYGKPDGSSGASGGEGGGMKDQGVRFPEKSDPAQSEEHGHASGVRRDSARERESADANRDETTDKE